MQDWGEISQYHCDIIRRRSGREFTNRAINEILKSVVRKGYNPTFFAVQGMLSYAVLAMNNEERDAVKTSGESFYIKINQMSDKELAKSRQQKDLDNLSYDQKRLLQENKDQLYIDSISLDIEGRIRKTLIDFARDKKEAIAIDKSWYSKIKVKLESVSSDKNIDNKQLLSIENTEDSSFINNWLKDNYEDDLIEAANYLGYKIHSIGDKEVFYREG